MSDNYKETNVWKNMSKQKQEIINQLVVNTKGKSLRESAPAVMLAVSMMNKEGLSFSKEESECMMDILTKEMSPAEKAQAEFIKGKFNKRSK